MSKIEWTGKTWNPVTGCTKISAGCKNCYAAQQWPRFAGRLYGGREFGDAACHPERLTTPLRRRKPTTYFVNSMSDLFHEAVPFEFIAAVFGVMAACPQHTFQVLTKRAERMREFFAWAGGAGSAAREQMFEMDTLAWCIRHIMRASALKSGISVPLYHPEDRAQDVAWPLPNVWLGVSVENQEQADKRIRGLLDTPAAARFVSAEPLLGAVEMQDQRGWLLPFKDTDPMLTRTPRLDWVIVGGESGPRARPCNVEWIRSIVEQCRAARVPAFVKQLGKLPVEPHELKDAGGGQFTHDELVYSVGHPKGGDPSEWPEDLRVREMPSQ